jgi:hypothetical protein
MHARTTTTALLLAAAATLSSCGTSTDAKPAAVRAAAAKASPAPEQQFLKAVHDVPIASWTTAGPSDAELLTYPEQWCAGLAGGHSAAYLFDMHQGNLYPIGQDWGTAEGDAYKVLVMGVTAYCPKYRSQLLDELRASGDY